MDHTEALEAPAQENVTTEEPQKSLGARLDAGMMACPVCGQEMPDLKGGKATICPACGFKDSCCY
jgi:membrane protease subunit (stomatin/prohibitin family)